MEPRSDMQALIARVARLEGQAAVLDLLHRYVHTIDYGDREGWLDCFVENGVVAVQRRDQEPPGRSYGDGDPHDGVLRYTSPAALGKFFETYSATPTTRQKHLLVAPRVSVADDVMSATARSYFAVVFDPGGQRVIRSFGRYVDEFTSCPDGEWRFVRRLIEVETAPAESRTAPVSLARPQSRNPHLR